MAARAPLLLTDAVLCATQIGQAYYFLFVFHFYLPLLHFVPNHLHFLRASTCSLARSCFVFRVRVCALNVFNILISSFERKVPKKNAPMFGFGMLQLCNLAEQSETITLSWCKHDAT